MAKANYSCIAILILALSAPANSWADYYFTAGIGSSEHHYRHDGFLVQMDMSHTEDRVQNMWSLGVGTDVRPWLDVELTYYDLGQWTNVIKFCSDESYDAYRCNPNVEGWHGVGSGRGETKALALSVLPTYHFGNAFVFARAGITYQWTKFEFYHVMAGDSVLQPLRDQAGNRTMVRDVGSVYGLGVGYKGLRLEYIEFPDVSGSDTAHDKVSAVTVSYMFRF